MIATEFKTTTVEGIPQWAETYIAYNDDSALSPEDKKLVDDFEDELFKEGLGLVCPIDGTENEFNPCPAFGLACDTLDWTAEVMPKKFKVRIRKFQECDIEVKAHTKAEAKRIAMSAEPGKDFVWETEKLKVVKCEREGE